MLAPCGRRLVHDRQLSKAIRMLAVIRKHDWGMKVSARHDSEIHAGKVGVCT